MRPPDQSDPRPLIVVFQMVRQVLGGVQTVIAEVFPRLLNEFRVVVVDPCHNVEFAEKMRAAGLEVAWPGRAPRRAFIGGKHSRMRPLYVLRSSPWLAGALLGFRRWVFEHQPAVVWFNQLPSARAFARVLPARGPALVYQAHGFVSAAEIGARTARFLSRRFHALIPVSGNTGRFLTQSGADPAKVRVIYNGVDAARVQSLAEGEGAPLPERPDQGVIFVQVGTVNRHKKAQHLSVAALAEVPPEFHAQLWICGDAAPGDQSGIMDELRGMVRDAGLQDRVHFLGWRRDVHRVVRAADVVLLPSLCHSEACPMVLAEAMAQGKPCIGSSIGGIPELIEHNVTGLVVQPVPRDLAAAMHTLAEFPALRERMGEAGRRREAELFSLDRQVAEIREVLREVVASGGR